MSAVLLKRSRDGRVRPPVRRPHKRAAMNTLLPHFSNFISVMREFAIKCRLCRVSASCRCNGGSHTHVQGRTASWDSSGSEEYQLPLDCVGRTAWVCKFQSTQDGVNTRVVLLAWLRLCCRLLRVPAVGPGRNRSIGTGHLSPRVCCRVFSAHWCCNRAVSRHFPHTRPGGKATCARPGRGTSPQSY